MFWQSAARLLGAVVHIAGICCLSGCQRIDSPEVAARTSIDDPYAVPGVWQKCNFHAHTRHSDGLLTGETLASLYAGAGYSVLCLSDHNQYGDQDGGVLELHQKDAIVHDWNGDGRIHPEFQLGSGVEAYVRDWNRPPPPWAQDTWFRAPEAKFDQSPTLIPGFEASFAYFGAHFVLIGYPAGPVAAPEPGVAFLDRLEPSGFAFVAHPGLANADAAKFTATLPVHRFHGIEIINGHFMSTGKVPYDATPLWDALLSSGYRLWGIGNDDAHQTPADSISAPFTVFTMVRAADASAGAVLSALHAGSSYVSTGLLFNELGCAEDTLVVAARGAEEIRFLSQGHLLLAVAADTARYHVKGNEGWVRIEAQGPGRARAWSQPFYVSSARP